MKRQRPCNNDSDRDSDIDTEVCCISCRVVYIPHDAGLCKECTDVVVAAEKNILEEINVLKAKADFLRLSSLRLGSNSRSFTNVVLIASNEAATAAPIPAHKAVVISRSPVFKAILENEMEENPSRTININEVSYEAFRTFVDYLYTAEECFDDQMAYDLFVLSDKYQVKELKSCCEMFLVTKLSVKKSLMAYVFAHQYNAKSLLDAALSQIIENMETITKREEYVKMVKHDSRLIIKIYEAYLSKQVAKTRASKTS